MKQIGHFIATLVFFLIINTANLWKGQLGMLHLVLSIFLFFYFLAISGFLVGQLFAAFDERLKDKSRLYLISFLQFTMLTTVLYPGGMINFDKLGSPTVLVAQMEGTANCSTTIQKSRQFGRLRMLHAAYRYDRIFVYDCKG